MSDPTTPTTSTPAPTTTSPAPPTPDRTADTAAGPRAHRGHVAHLESRAAMVGTIAAAVLLVVAGAVQILEGVSAVEADDIIVVGPQYTYQWNSTGWGVVHIVIGALLVVVAGALFTGRIWGRAIAIVLAAASIVANFLWLPHNPWWSVLVIALDAFLIWAVATWHHHAPAAATPAPLTRE
ncbi:DUF7144 family membrane protein [Nocardia terpenica]|uniref:DUF7144 family membrane protein n=1 Tax=Nocardia terpenica TaxID=455432 RepID=UPI002B4AFFC4|nr:hypothetical protein [Nocardia terpenica]